MICIENTDGSHLYPVDGSTVNRTVCAAQYDGNCCYQELDIQIKDCGCYYVYYLIPTTGSFRAYCFW